MKKYFLKISVAVLGLCLMFSLNAQQPELEGMPNVEVQSTAA